MAARNEVLGHMSFEQRRDTIVSILERGQQVRIYPKFMGDPEADEIVKLFSSFGYRITPRANHHIIHPPEGIDY